jgi:hypothetical protein
MAEPNARTIGIVITSSAETKQMREPMAFSYNIMDKERACDADPSVAFIILLFILLLVL